MPSAKVCPTLTPFLNLVIIFLFLACGEEMERASKSHIVGMKRSIKHISTDGTEEEKESLTKIESQHKECLKLCKEKIDLANRAYDVVSAFILSVCSPLQSLSECKAS